ncbi:MAG: PAS domain S-box protein, partial [Desulfobacteraceae bacterium]
MKQNRHMPFSELGSMKVAGIYALFSALWILLSDQILYIFVKDPDLMTRIQMGKGWAFILISALIIYILLRKEIRKHLRTADALRESEEKYRLLFNSANDAVFVHCLSDSKDAFNGMFNRFLEFNDIACQKYGYLRNDLLKLTPTDLLAPGMKTRVQKHVDTLLDNKRHIFETMHQSSEGRVFPVEISAFLFDY